VTWCGIIDVPDIVILLAKIKDVIESQSGSPTHASQVIGEIYMNRSETSDSRLVVNKAVGAVIIDV
jgi:hypothetical protein